MDILSTKFNFNSLSLPDLVEARDLFHVHLINKKNVVATAVGKYRIRKTDPWPAQKGYLQTLSPTSKKQARTLQNSEVRDYSWPCILVFVEQWEDREDLAKSGMDDIVPRCIYMPDGRVVPICVIQAPPTHVTDDSVNTSSISFPSNYVGGGFPLILQSQGVERIASIGCVVTDGNKYYALTNKHVTGAPGTTIYTNLKGKRIKIGESSSKQLGKINFEDVYDGWKGKKIFVNNDIGLMEIKDQRIWKTQILQIGEMEKLADLSETNFSLSLIATSNAGQTEALPKVKAFGAVSGLMTGEIIALFYRYKSVGGLEYVSDFLIGGENGEPLSTHFGDSGTLWLLEQQYEDKGEDGKDKKKKKYYPMAIHWGQHTFIDTDKNAYAFALASNLTTACTRLEIDVVRGWNLDNEFSWGKTGHFKIAAKACELTSDTDLDKLLMANQKNIGYVDNDLISGDVVSGDYTQAKDKFVPLADVADIIWRATRKLDSSNHFADIDESHPQVEGGQTLMEMCSKDKNIDIDVWIKYFAAFDAVKPNKKKREGALPFRVWQMYNQMITSLKKGNLEEFICAGGTMSHYVGDACQALHISYLHHGRNKQEEDVHTAYETTMVDANMSELFTGVQGKAKKVTASQLIGPSGKEAAKLVLKLMKRVHTNLPPVEICDSYSDNAGKGRTAAMWKDLGSRTIENVADGCNIMAVLWQSAWVAGNGKNIPKSKLVSMSQAKLKKLYETKTFVQSYKMTDPAFKAVLV